MNTSSKLLHKFKMLKKLRDRNAPPTRILRAMRAFEKEKENVQTGLNRTKSNDTEKLKDQKKVF